MKFILRISKSNKDQDWEFAHLLIAHLLIAHSLICSNRSGQMKKCERFAQVPQDK